MNDAKHNKKNRYHLQQTFYKHCPEEHTSRTTIGFHFQGNIDRDKLKCNHSGYLIDRSQLDHERIKLISHRGVVV